MEAIFSYIDSIAVWKLAALAGAVILVLAIYDKCVGKEVLRRRGK
jgi:hypothetical protein